MRKILLFIFLAASLLTQTAKAQDWNEIIKAVADDGAADDWFGHSVSVSGEVAIVGAYQDDDNGNNSGSAYIFERQGGGNWVQVQKIVASDRASSGFGISLSVSGEVAIVGAYSDYYDINASGSAYIFEKSGGVWSETAKLTASDGVAVDRFGISLSVSGEVAIVGTYCYYASGSAYIFEKSGGVWSETAKLTASDGAAVDLFGMSVSVSGDVAFVGAHVDDDNGSESGSAYFFESLPFVPDTLIAQTISEDKINLSWDGTCPKFKVMRKTDSTSADHTDGFIIYQGSDKSLSLSGLDTNTTYFFTVFGVNEEETAFSIGSQKAVASTLPWEDSSSTHAKAGFLAGETDSTRSLDSVGVEIVITAPSGSDGYLELLRLNVAPESGNLPESAETGNGTITPSMIYESQFWRVTNNGLSGFEYEIIISLDGIPGIGNPLDLCVFKRANSGDDWSDAAAGSATIAYDSELNALIISGLTSFSEFVIGSDGGDNPLPVELSAFSGVSTNVGIKLNWQTQTETDNAGFVLMRNGNEIAGYTTTEALKGQGTTSQSQSYTFTDGDVSLDQTYSYQLVSVDYSGKRHSYPQTIEVKVVEAIETGKPQEYALEQNYPNPFNPSTTIGFTMKKAGVATLKVYDMLGRNVFEKQMQASVGANSVTFDAHNLTSGVYFYQLNTKGFSKTMKMMLVR